MTENRRIFVYVMVVLMLTLLVAPPVNRFLCSIGVINHTELGNIVMVEPKGNAVLDAFESLKAFLTDTYTNYLPFYNEIVAAASSFKYLINKPVDILLANMASTAASSSGVVSTKNSPVADYTTSDNADTKSEITAEPELYIVSSTARLLANNDARNIHRYYAVTLELSDGSKVQLLERAVSIDDDTKAKRLNESIIELNRICSYRKDEVNYYIFAGTRTQDTSFSSDVMPQESSTAIDFELFRSSLPENVRFDYLRFDTISDRLRLAYLTDHHWSADGIKEAYGQILDMMRLDTPDIGEMRESGKLLTAPGVRFYGSLARLTGYYSLYDPFTFYDYDLPEHKVRGGVSFKEKIKAFMAGKINAGRGSALYEELYPAPVQIVYPGNNTGRRLLIIGDSYARGMCELIASHFDVTYTFFPGRECDLDKHIDSYGVTDVLILMTSDRLLYRVYGQLRWSDYKTG